MKYREFLDTLNSKCLDGITYNIYTTEMNDSEIDLQNEKDDIVENQVHNLLYTIVQSIILDLVKTHNVSLEDEFSIELPDFLESVMTVKYEYQELLSKSEEACEDEDQQKAIVKVRMINDDIFTKIPVIAGEILHGPQ